MRDMRDGQKRDVLSLVRDLCQFGTGVVSKSNADLFKRLGEELAFTIWRYCSGSTFNGWVVPDGWRVEKALILRNGRVVFDGKAHALGVAGYSKSFQGELDLEVLKKHIVTKSEIPEAYVYHCMWQYRPWDADWAFSIPYEIYKTFTPGRYRVDLVTEYAAGEMLVAEYQHRGRSDSTIVFNAHTCHPHMANDDFAGVAMLVLLFQWLRTQETYYTYRLVLGPEHLGTVFYLRDQTADQLQRLVCGAFAEMPGTKGALKVASSFLGDQVIDRAFRNVARHYTKKHELVPWRRGAGNDETVWEAPGYEVPFVEVSRSEDLLCPYREYHTSLDTPDLMSEEQLDEFFGVFRGVVEILERNAVLNRRFKGLVCLSNPQYALYMERPDPAVSKNLQEDSEKWGYLADCLPRYFDGTMSILDIAEKHDLPFDRLYDYLVRFEEKGLIQLKFTPIQRVAISQIAETPSTN